jgi:tetratricopeptide (TPR) repeat protein
MRLAPTLCALILAAGPALAASKSRTKSTSSARARAAQLRERGLKAVAAGQEDEALRAFGLAIEADPKEEISHHEIGKIFFRRGQTQEAIAHFRAAVKLQPKDTSAWYDLAYAARSAQTYPEAADAYRRYVALSPDDPDGYYGLAESLRQSNRPGEAIAAYEQYVGKEKRESEQKWVQRAKDRIAELQPQADAEAQKKAEAEAQKKAEADAKAEAEARKKAEAEAEAQKKKDQAAASAAAAPVVAPMTAALPASAAASAETSSPAAETAAAAGMRVIVHGTNGAVAKTPPPGAVDPAAKVAEGDSAYAAKDFRIALYAYQDAIMADSKNVAARVKAGIVYAKMGHDPEAIEQWNRALALDPSNQDAQDGLAGAQARRAARQSGTTIVTVTPPATAAAAATAMPATATATSAPPAAMPPASPSPATAAMTAAPAVANPLTTLTAVPAASTAPPSFAPAPAVATGVDETAARQHYSAGVSLMRDRKYEAAVAELDQAIVLRPGYANALIARGSARISLGRFPEAAQDYGAARAADPTLAAPLFGLAEAYRQMGEPARAIEMYRAFAESNAADAQPNLKAYARQTADSLSRK